MTRLKPQGSKIRKSAAKSGHKPAKHQYEEHFPNEILLPESLKREPPNLAIPISEAIDKIQLQLSKWRTLKQMNTGNSGDFQLASKNYVALHDVTVELLRRLFSNREVEFDFSSAAPRSIRNPSKFVDCVNQKTVALTRILNRVEIGAFQSNLGSLGKAGTKPAAIDNSVRVSDVFIVHGHDEAVKEAVSRFVEKIGLRAVILHEQPNAGRTIIEKFEAHSNVGFAIVLLTPDDIGAPSDKKDKTQPRARQNVILELGYFMGKLGRGKVCALYKEGVEIPSDYQGVLYIPMDSASAWRMQLGKEIKNAGIDVDLNKL